MFTRDFRESQWKYLRRKTCTYWLLGNFLIKFQIIIKVLPWTSQPHERPTKRIPVIWDEWLYQYGWIKSKRGEVIFNPIYIADFEPLYRALKKAFRKKKKLQHDFSKMKGGGGGSGIFRRFHDDATISNLKNILLTNLFGKVLTLTVSFVWPLLDLLNLSQNLWQDVMYRDWRMRHGVLLYGSAFKNLFTENENII